MRASATDRPRQSTGVARQACLLTNKHPAASSFLTPTDAKERSASRFSADGVFNYTSVLLSREDETLYVGAREALFALNLADMGHARLQRNVSVFGGPPAPTLNTHSAVTQAGDPV